MSAAAGAWNFGLCATRSREPRQARKGATVSGLPRVPQITRSSSPRKAVCSRVLKVESRALASVIVMLAGAMAITFFMVCAALVFCVFWLKKQSGSSK
jgi:hypothetical protein